ncbi:MAG: dockerin type I domain-containing protein [Planctomycetia bacterium]
MFLLAAMIGQGQGAVIPNPGYRATEYLAGEDFDAFSMLDTNTALLYNGVGATPGIEVRDLSTGTMQILLEQPSGICDGATRADDFLTGSFIKQDPTAPNTYWVGFVANWGVDGWIYQVTANQTGDNWTSTWNQVALLPGNYDMTFSVNSLLLASANIDGTGNKIVAVDTSGANDHTVVAEVGGYSAGVDVNAAGDAYYATYPSDESDERLLRFASSDIDDAVAVGGSPCSPTVLCNLTLDGVDFGGNGLAVDAADHVLVAGNPNGHIALWDEATQSLSTVAVSSDWLGNIETVGDFTNGGAAYVTAWGQGITKITKLIPGDANGDGTVDSSDATILAGNWQSTANVGWAEGDFNGDGAVDSSDATILAGNWQASLNTANTVPEPSSLALLVTLAILGFATARRRKTSQDK